MVRNRLSEPRLAAERNGATGAHFRLPHWSFISRVARRVRPHFPRTVTYRHGKPRPSVVSVRALSHGLTAQLARYTTSWLNRGMPSSLKTELHFSIADRALFPFH